MNTKFDEINIFDDPLSLDELTPKRTSISNKSCEPLTKSPLAMSQQELRATMLAEREQRKQKKFSIKHGDPDEPKLNNLWDFTRAPITSDDFMQQTRKDYQELTRMRAWLVDNKLDSKYVNYKNQINELARRKKNEKE